MRSVRTREVLQGNPIEREHLALLRPLPNSLSPNKQLLVQIAPSMPSAPPGPWMSTTPSGNRNEGGTSSVLNTQRPRWIAMASRIDLDCRTESLDVLNTSVSSRRYVAEIACLRRAAG